jgi:hypothetical protein
MKRGTPDHPKTLALMQALSIPRPMAVGLLELLWHFTSRYAPQGDIGRWTDDNIAQGLSWDGNSSELLAGFVKSGWIDTHEKHRLVIHDWHDHADEATKKSLARNKLSFVTLSRRRRDVVATSRDKSRPPEPSQSLSQSQAKAGAAQADTDQSRAVVDDYNSTTGSRIGYPGNVELAEKALEAGITPDTMHRVFVAVRDRSTPAAKWWAEQHKGFDWLMRTTYKRKSDGQVMQGGLIKIPNELAGGKILSLEPRGNQRAVEREESSLAFIQGGSRDGRSVAERLRIAGGKPAAEGCDEGGSVTPGRYLPPGTRTSDG